VVIDDFDVPRFTVSPGEAKPPLIIDPNTMLPLAATLQRLEPVSTDPGEVAQGCGALQVNELPYGALLNCLELFREFLPEDLLCFSIASRR